MCGSFLAESPDSTMAKAGELPLQGELVISLAAWGQMTAHRVSSHVRWLQSVYAKQKLLLCC